MKSERILEAVDILFKALGTEGWQEDDMIELMLDYGFTEDEIVEMGFSAVDVRSMMEM